MAYQLLYKNYLEFRLRDFIHFAWNEKPENFISKRTGGLILTGYEHGINTIKNLHIDRLLATPKTEKYEMDDEEFKMVKDYTLNKLARKMVQSEKLAE